MRRITVLTCAFAAFGMAVHAQRATREQHVFVSVTNAEHRPVTTLTPADLIVREDGLAREVIAIGQAPPPTHVALLVDDSQAASPLLSHLPSALTAFITTMATGDDHPAMSLVTFGERPTKQVDFTPNPATVQKAAGSIFPKPGAGAHFLDAVVETCATFAKLEAARPVIVALVVESGPEFSERTHDSVDRALTQAHASLWVVELRNPRGGDEGPGPGHERALVMTDIATASGGGNQMVLSAEGLAGGFDAVAGTIRARQDVTYARPDSMIPPSSITVSARDRTWHVSAPKRIGS